LCVFCIMLFAKIPPWGGRENRGNKSVYTGALRSRSSLLFALLLAMRLDVPRALRATCHRFLPRLRLPRLPRPLESRRPWRQPTPQGGL
jgi:hypothetical protein